MATINRTSETRTYLINKWLGLNENPDGDTKIKYGEAAVMENWRITKDGNLQIRPGFKTKVTLDPNQTAVKGLWYGYINGTQTLVASCAGKLYTISGGEKTEIGDVIGDYAHFFGFGEKLYLLTGSKYYVYDGVSLSEVAGYVPLVAVSTLPTGGGTTLEQINKLNGKRRVQFSPDGKASTFQLPEKSLVSVDSVKSTVDGTVYTESTDYSVDLTNGTVTFTSAPEAGVNSIEIAYTVATDSRSQVESMRFSESYNGTTDARVFLYGDGSNKAIYSDLDGNGKPTAEYFPDMNEMSVDSENTPITAMIKHYNSLLTFKSDGAYTTNYGTITLTDGSVTAAFYTTPLNRSIGNVAPGQAVLVKNNPFTLFGRSVYEWQLSSYAVKDERNAKTKSERVASSLGALSLKDAVCYDDEYTSQYFIVQGDTAIVYNYAADAWYKYTGIPAVCFVRVEDKLYFGTSDGRLAEFSRAYRNDDGREISARWESGSMSFDADYRMKYSSDIWISLKPESAARLKITVQSNRRSDYAEKVTACSLATFANVDFNNYSFNTNRQPQVDRIRLKVKKFAFYKLIFTSASTSATATVLAADIRVRYAGNIK